MAILSPSGRHSRFLIQVGVFSSSQSTINKATDIGDPSMIIMPAEGQYSADYTFSTPTYRKPEGSDTDLYTIYVLVCIYKVLLVSCFAGYMRFILFFPDVCFSY